MKSDRKIKVFLVDDHPVVREGVRSCLRHYDQVEVVGEAANGHEAIDRAKEFAPDIILMDLALPKVDGWEATKRLKSDPRTKHIPIVALTGHALAGFAEGAREAGCDAFVTKPCLPDALVAEIRRMLAKTQQHDGGRHGGEPSGQRR